MQIVEAVRDETGGRLVLLYCATGLCLEIRFSAGLGENVVLGRRRVQGSTGSQPAMFVIPLMPRRTAKGPITSISLRAGARSGPRDPLFVGVNALGSFLGNHSTRFSPKYHQD